MREVTPLSLKLARRAVRRWHRHLPPPPVHLFSVALWDGAALLGVAIVGPPVSRVLAAQGAAEITRVATDGSHNACSQLYGAARREARRRGIPRLVTYTRADEPGTSLRAAGYRESGRTNGRQWDTPSRRRRQREMIDRVRWDAW